MSRTNRVRVQCYRAPDGKHRFVKDMYDSYCLFCWVKPVLINGVHDPKPQPASGGQRFKAVTPPKGQTRRNRIEDCARRDGWSCFYCEVGLDIETATLDHLMPR